MFLKLLKHDLISLKNSFFILFIITVCVAVIAPFLVYSLYKYSMSGNDGIGLSYLLLFGIYSLVLLFIIVVAILFLINAVRFFKNSFFSSQGYLTLTLPISTSKNVISKLLAIIIWAIAFSLVAYISFFIAMIILDVLLVNDSSSTVTTWESIQQMFQSIFDTSSFEGANATDIIAFILKIFVIIISPILSLVLMLLIITLGNIKPFKKHSVLSSILFAIVIYFAISIGSTNIATYITDSIVKYVVILLLEIALTILGVFGIVKLIDHKVEIS